MEDKHNNKSVVTTRSFAECFLDKEIIENMTEDQKNEASKEILLRLSQIVSYPYQPERLTPEEGKKKEYDPILSPDWIVNLQPLCDSPTPDNK